MKKSEDRKNFIDIANSVGELVQEKNIAYGNSFAKSQNIVKILYPNGVQPEQYMDMLAITRVIDKLFRIATKKDAFGESPWRDICGYAILGIANDEEGVVEEKEEQNKPTLAKKNKDENKPAWIEEVKKDAQKRKDINQSIVDSASKPSKTNTKLWEEQQEETKVVTYRDLLRNPDKYMTAEEQEMVKESVRKAALFKALSEEGQERIIDSVELTLESVIDKERQDIGHGNPYANIDENDSEDNKDNDHKNFNYQDVRMTHG